MQRKAISGGTPKAEGQGGASDDRWRGERSNLNAMSSPRSEGGSQRCAKKRQLKWGPLGKLASKER